MLFHLVNDLNPFDVVFVGLVRSVASWEVDAVLILTSGHIHACILGDLHECGDRTLKGAVNGLDDLRDGRSVLATVDHLVQDDVDLTHLRPHPRKHASSRHSVACGRAWARPACSSMTSCSLADLPSQCILTELKVELVDVVALRQSDPNGSDLG